jgi:hypothetical protein
MSIIEKPRTMAELETLYANLRAELTPASGVVEQQHGSRFEDEVLTTTTLVIPIWYNGEELGVFSLYGERILGSRTAGKAAYDAVRTQYTHVLAPKAKQSFAECKRGNLDADKALSKLVKVLESMIRNPLYHVSFHRIPQGDNTSTERLLSGLFSVLGVFSSTLEERLRRSCGVQVRPKNAIFTARELCRVLSEVMRNELVFRMPTMAEEIAYLESPAYRAQAQEASPATPAAPYIISGRSLSRLGKEKVGTHTSLLLVPAAS